MNHVATSAFSQPAARLCGITAWASLLVLVCMTVLAGAFTPGYSHVGQFISELGARGAPQEWGVRWVGFLPLGILLLAFCRFAHIALPRSPGTTFALVGLALYALGYLAATAFPCDLGCRPSQPSMSQLIHNALGLLGYLLAPLFLLAFARAARTWPNGARVSAAGYAAAGLALLGMVTLSSESGIAGLGQRLLELSVLGWVACCGAYTARQGAH